MNLKSWFYFQNIRINTASSSSEAEESSHANRTRLASNARSLPRPITQAHPSQAPLRASLSPPQPQTQPKFSSVITPPRALPSPDVHVSHAGTQREKIDSLLEKIDSLDSKVLTLKAQNQVILETQNKILCLLISRQAEEELEMDSNIVLPISDEATLKKTEAYLEERGKRQHMSAILSGCVTPAFESTTRNILKKIFPENSHPKWIGLAKEVWKKFH